jgi:hypothetical protein
MKNHLIYVNCRILDSRAKTYLQIFFRLSCTSDPWQMENDLKEQLKSAFKIGDGFGKQRFYFSDYFRIFRPVLRINFRNFRFITRNFNPFLMTRTMIVALALLPCMVFSQDYPKMAKDIQQKYKDAEAVIIQSGTDFVFVKDPETGAKITISQNKSLLSLRYNEAISEVEVYDQHSRIEKFSAESNLKQKAPDGAKLCGTYTNEGLFYDDSKFCTHQLKLKEVGEVWDVRSVKKLSDAKYLTTVFFQEKYPLGRVHRRKSYKKSRS